MKEIIRYYARRGGLKLLQQPFWRRNPLSRYAILKRVEQRTRQVEAKILPPRQVHLECTNLCNSRCIMCPYSSMQRPRTIMDHALFLKGLHDARELGTEWIQPQFFGEPFLDPTFDEKLQACKNMGFYLSLYSNGAVLDEGKANMLIELAVDEVHISIDSLRPEVYEDIRRGLSYETVTKNVERLMSMKRSRNRQKPVVWINFVEFDRNRNETRAFFDHWRRIVDRVNISVAHEWADHVKMKAGRSLNTLRFPCPSPWQQLVVTAQGEILPCCRDYEGEQLSLGNLREITLRQAWEGDPMRRLREKLKACRYHEISLCRDCYPNDIAGWRH